LPFEIDHLFVCTDVGGPEADELIRFGLTEGASNRHRGQGTASRHFFFHNAALELIWVHDDEEARSSATERTRLFERWHGRNGDACPFGLCVRQRDAATALPFDAWPYEPIYLPKPWAIHIAANSEDVSEPMLFCIHGRVAPEAFPESYRQPLDHAIGFREISRLNWLRPQDAPLSPELNALLREGLLNVGSAPSHLLEIGFDDEAQGRRASFAPTLPIAFVW
jgi:hypothetical protein